MAFLETPRFPTNLSYGTSLGPEWKSETYETYGGGEKTNSAWTDALHVYNVAYGVATQSDLMSLKDFFMRTRGPLHRFRFKDWLDFQATGEALAPDGSPTVQLTKTYGAGGATEYVRDIKKPRSGISMTRNSSSFTAFSLDDTTGTVTLNADATANITNITQANPGRVRTSSAHGYATGDEVYIDSVSGMTEVNETVYTIAVISDSLIANITQANPGQVTTASAHNLQTGDKVEITGVNGMTEVNGNAYTVTVVDSTNFTIGVDTTGYGAYTSGGTVDPVNVFTIGVDTSAYAAYTSGGTANKYVQSSEDLTWTGEFDVPCRFVDDVFEPALTEYQAGSASVIVKEVRL